MAINEMLNTAMRTASASPLTEIAGSLLLAGKGRTIMGLFADVTIEEKHKDELQITEHPTEVGSSISDHAYKEAPEVTMKIGWSASAGRLNGLIGDTFLGGTLGLVGIYEILQQLQNNKVLLVVSTGKRLYTNMLIKSLANTTEMSSENALMIDLTFKKVNIVQTHETNVLIENQKSPEATAGVQNGGTVQPQPVQDESILSSIKTAIFG